MKKKYLVEVRVWDDYFIEVEAENEEEAEQLAIDFNEDNESSGDAGRIIQSIELIDEEEEEDWD